MLPHGQYLWFEKRSLQLSAQLHNILSYDQVRANLGRSQCKKWALPHRYRASDSFIAVCMNNPVNSKIA